MDFNEIEDSRIFKNKAVLSPHYVPHELLYRENELKRMMEGVAPVFKGFKPKNVLIYGKTGTGKSITSKKLLEKMDEMKNEKVKGLYLNCRVYDTRYKVFQKLVSELKNEFSKTGYSFALLYETVLDWIEEKERFIILVLDEIDFVKDIDALVYSITRANDDIKKGGLSMIGISNKIQFKQKLGERSKSSICEDEIVFQTYNSNQLQGILNQRVPLSFNEGVMSPSAINLSAAIAARENGDARYALNLLLRSGELSERKKLNKITDREVEEARKMAEEDKTSELISTLPAHQQLVLYALAMTSTDVSYKKLIEDGGEKYYFSGEVYEHYTKISKKFGFEPISARWYREYIHELEEMGLISSIHSGSGVRGQTTLLKLALEESKVRKIIEKSLMK
jgi:cell division control protein 6